LCNVLQPPATFSLLSPNILLSTLFCNSLYLCTAKTHKLFFPYILFKILCNKIYK
jgi:hypothetical protein